MKQTWLALLLAGLLTLGLFSGCAAQPAAPAEKPLPLELTPTGIEVKTPEGFSAFDHRLIAFLKDQGLEKENFTVSPLSFKAALALLAEGAEGESRDQLLTALGVDSMEALEAWYDAVLETQAVFQEAAGYEDREMAYELVNAVWHNTSLPGTLVPEYLTKLADRFQAEGHSETADKITAAVNDWAKEKTHGLIPQVIDDASDSSVLLANALYLKTPWTEEFAEIGDGAFTDLEGKETVKPFLQQESWFDYYEDPDCQLVVLDLLGGIRMALVLGDNTDVVQKLRAAENQRVRVTMPSLDLESAFEKHELCRFLASLGCEKMFEPLNGDFGSMFTEDLYVNDIIQKARVKTDKNGLEAAAVTVIDMKCGAAAPDPTEPKIFTADRPFSFYIYTDTEAEAPELLFYGQVVK